MDRYDRSGFGINPDSIQKHSLSDATEPVEDEAPGAPAKANAV
jgi:hypothetical protein